MSTIFRRTVVFALAAALLAGASPAWSKNHGQAVYPGIYRLNGMDAGLPDGDLQPLSWIVAGASVVALGETAHTSGGYYRMKHRIFRFLVEEMRFRAFAFETTWSRADRVATYLESCRTVPQGTADDARQGLYAVWQSTETRDLIQWMCDWNQAHPGDPVTFFGFDVQQPHVDGPALLAFLERIGIPAVSPLAEGIRTCDGVVELSFPDPIRDEDYQSCLAALGEVEELFEEEAWPIIRQTSWEDLQWAKIRLVGVRGWEEAAYDLEGDPIRRFEARDKAMAYVFEHIRKLRVGHARTAIWAANDHIVKHDEEINGTRGMGTWLEERFGHRYAAVALIAREPVLNWNFVFCGPFPIEPGSVEDLLSNAFGEDFLLVDTRTPFLERNRLYYVGPGPYQPRKQWDALVYLRHSPAMTSLRWETCQPPEP